MRIVNILSPLISGLLTSFLVTPSAVADTCENPPIDNMFIVANSLRTEPMRDKVANNILNLHSAVSATTTDLVTSVAFDFMPDVGTAAYNARRDAAKLVTIYVNDTQEPLIADYCSAANLDSGCTDWPMDKTWYILLNQLAHEEPFAPQLVHVVHFQDGEIAYEEVHSLIFDGQDAFQNQNFSDALNLLIKQVQPEGCDGGPIIGV